MGTKFGQEAWARSLKIIIRIVIIECGSRAWRGKYGNRGIVKEEELEERRKKRAHW